MLICSTEDGGLICSIICTTTDGGPDAGRMGEVGRSALRRVPLAETEILLATAPPSDTAAAADVVAALGTTAGTGAPGCLMPGCLLPGGMLSAPEGALGKGKPRGAPERGRLLRTSTVASAAARSCGIEAACRIARWEANWETEERQAPRLHAPRRSGCPAAAGATSRTAPTEKAGPLASPAAAAERIAPPCGHGWMRPPRGGWEQRNGTQSSSSAASATARVGAAVAAACGASAAAGGTGGPSPAEEALEGTGTR